MYSLHSWIYIANPKHQRKLETETEASAADDDYTDYTIVRDERGEKRFREKHPDSKVKIVQRDNLKKLPFDKRFYFTLSHNLSLSLSLYLSHTSFNGVFVLQLLFYIVKRFL